MTNEQYEKNLLPPDGTVDAILDTDAYNEIDDQFAITYFLRSKENINPIAIYAAPFLNERSISPKDGMEKSHKEILKLLTLCKREDMVKTVKTGAENFLPDENTPVPSPASRDLIEKAKKYSPEKPLYIISIGAATNLASALIEAPEIAENIVIVWLGGNGRHYKDGREFNLMQDIAAARVIFLSGAPFIQLPCVGVVSAFNTCEGEMKQWLYGKNPLADYLSRSTVAAAELYAKGKPWTRAIWDVTAVAFLTAARGGFMDFAITDMLLPSYDFKYEAPKAPRKMTYVSFINRDRLMEDLFKKILE